MDRDETMERIKSCMAMESVCAGVYHLLSLNFQEEKELWNKLAVDDESLAEMIASVLEFKESENLSDFPVPEDLPHVRETIEYARETSKLLVNDKLSLRSALERLQKLHELKSRGYDDLLEKEKEDKIRHFFKKIFKIDKLNMDMIRSFIISYQAQGGR